MAEGKLTSEQLMELSLAIPIGTWETIASGYFELSDGEIRNIKASHPSSVTHQSNDIITTWINKNPKDHVKVRIRKSHKKTIKYLFKIYFPNKNVRIKSGDF